MVSADASRNNASLTLVMGLYCAASGETGGAPPLTPKAPSLIERVRHGTDTKQIFFEAFKFLPARMSGSDAVSKAPV